MRNDFSRQRSALTHRTAKLGTTLSGFVLLLLGQACGSRYQIGEIEPPPGESPPPPGESPPPPGEASTGAADIVPVLVLDSWKDADAHLDISHNRLLVVGDVDGDGFGDFDDHGQLVYGTPRAAQGRTLSIENGPFFSISGDAPLGDGVVSAGDFNGDGYSDLLIAGTTGGYFRPKLSELSSEDLTAENEFFRNVTATKAFLWYGGPERGCCKHVLENEAVGFRMTEDLTGPTRAALAEGGDVQYQVTYDVRPLALGDLDGDGSDDFAITARLYGYRGNETDRIEASTYIYYGQREHFALATNREPDSRLAGVQWIQPMGDLNGDGHADILATTPTGGLYLIGGSAQRLPAIPALDAIGVPLLAEPDPWYTSPLPLGDIDGDGCHDFSIASVEDEGEKYSNYIFYGSPSLLGGPVDRSAASANILIPRGEALSGAGDCNGDGRSDLLIVQNTPTADGDHSSTTVFTSASRRFSGQYEVPHFASEFADSTSVDGYPAGDLDGDGLADLFLSTAPPNPNGQNTWYVKYGTPLPNPIR